MKFVKREQWGAPASSPAPYIGSTRGTKVHYLGSAYARRLHGDCADAVRGIRTQHLNHPTEDYVDIAYNALVCDHGYVFEGRGAHKKTGANGSSTLNAGHYAVCALLGSAGLTKPSSAMLNGIRDAVGWLRTAGSAGGEIKGHRDGWPTACPGDPLYTWVRNGAPRPQEDDVPLTDADVSKIVRRLKEELPEAVWTRDGIVKAPVADASNSHWAPGSLLRNNNQRLRELEEAVAAIRRKLGA